MENPYRPLLITLLIILLTSNISCRKEQIKVDTSTNGKNNKGKTIKSLSEKQAIADWLEAKEKGLNATDQKTMQVVSNNLDYDNIRFETRKNEENIIIIPIKETAKEHLNISAKYLSLNENSTLNLMVIQDRDGKLRWSSIVAFLPADGKKRQVLPDRTIQNILNNETVNEEGMFKFIDLNSRLAYQLEYKKGKLFSWGTPMRKDQLPSNQLPKPATKKSSGTKVMNYSLPTNCIAYYLVTTYYDTEGVYIDEEEEYLFTICEDSGSGPTPSGPVTNEYDDQEVETDEGFTLNNFPYTDKDISQVSLGIDFVEWPLIPEIQYRASIRRSARFRLIKSIIMENPVITDGKNVEFYNPFKQSQCIRNTTIFDFANLKLIDPTRVFANLTWSHEYHQRYSYFLNHPEETEQHRMVRNAFVNAFTTGYITY